MPKFPNIPRGVPICVDLETTSFDDKTEALNPWDGHKVAGYALAAKSPRTKRVHSWYFPVRHQGDPDNMDQQQVWQYFQDLFNDSTREVFNQNNKFDGRFARVAEGHTLHCDWVCTMPLARLVNNTHRVLGLDHLAEVYTGSGKVAVDGVKGWCKAAKTKDYGRVPIRVMTPYACGDTEKTWELRRELERRLPDYSRPLWNLEKRFTKVLLDAEISGVRVDVRRLKEDYVGALQRILDISERINEIAGYEVDLGSRSDKADLLFRRLKIPVTKTTLSGQPSMTKADLSNLDTSHLEGDEAEIGNLFRNYQYLTHFTTTYIEGWLSRIDGDGVLHPDIKQAGTQTGRLSVSNPNTQNIPVEAERFVIAPDGYVIVGFDWSQVEYRIFAHYTQDPEIMGAYMSDEDADFHQHLADKLGVARQFAKTLNFSFLYGMGKAKLLKSLAAMMAVVSGADKDLMAERLRTLTFASGVAVAERADAFSLEDPEALQTAAEQVYHDYHKQFPSIKQFANRVNNTAKHRKWVRNLYGRRYWFDMDMYDSLKQKRAFGPHRAVNYLIQGSCADMLRYKIVEMADGPCRQHGAQLFMTVHDSVYYYVPRAEAAAFYLAAKAVLEDNPGIRVPVQVSGTVATKAMSAHVDLERRHETIDGITAALKQAETEDDHGFGVVVKSQGYRVGRHGI